MKVTIQIDGLPSLRSIRSALPTTLPSLPRLVGPIVVALSLILSSFSVAAVLSAPRYATVGVPQTVGFEGFLAQANGQPIANGPYQLTFRVYDVATGGAALWDQDITNVQVTNGLYSVALGGSADPFTSTTFDSDRWVGVTVDGGSEITPRTRVSSVPFALNADNANRIGGGGTANMVVAFDGPCPSGWTEFAAAQGRVVVGVPTNGELGGIVPGSIPLGDKEDRTHTIRCRVISMTCHSDTTTALLMHPLVILRSELALQHFQRLRGSLRLPTPITQLSIL